MASILLNSTNKLAFEAWMAETGIDLVQVNGQRKFGGPPPGWTGPPPLSGSEVFIGKLPQDLYEDTLIPLFQSAGKLYEFRLMMTFSGENRGFAYAKYANRCYAQCAIAMFNGYRVRDGRPILVCWSTEKDRLCIGGIPLGRSREEVLVVLRELTAGVSDLALHLSTDRKKEMTKFAIVKYEGHRAAALAKKKLVEGSIELWGQPIEVDWVKPDRMQKRLSDPSPSLSLPVSPGMAGELCLLPVCCAPSPSSSTVKRGRLPRQPESEESSAPLNEGRGLVRLLNAYCAKKQLGVPMYRVQPLGLDEHCFLFKVFLPGLDAHFSGTVMLTPGDLALAQDVLREEVARQVLMFLGF
ncbi:dead end protein homolog 1-like isoform X2 [Mobula hypostoma]